MKSPKFLKRFWPYAVVPTLILFLHLVGFAVTPLQNGPYFEVVMKALYLIPVVLGWAVVPMIIGDCPGLGFDGGPCENSEFAVMICAIALWWGLLTFIIAQAIQVIRRARSIEKKV